MKTEKTHLTLSKRKRRILPFFSKMTDSALVPAVRQKVADRSLLDECRFRPTQRPRQQVHDFAMLLVAQVAHFKSSAQGDDALTVHSSAVKSKWVRWKENNHETRAGRPCQGCNFERLGSRGHREVFLGGCVPETERRPTSISHFGMAQRRTCQPVRHAWSCNLTRGQGRDLQLDFFCSHHNMVKFVQEAEQHDSATVISPDRTAGAPQEHAA